MQVLGPADVVAARQMIRGQALALGVDNLAVEDLAVVATELASNLVRHAGSGAIRVRGITHGGQTGIQIEAHDAGPGFADVEQALTDGYSSGGGLGYGLGTVKRLMDELEIASREDAGVGAHIVCRRWRRLTPQRDLLCQLDFGVASQAYPGLDVNGDDFLIKQWEDFPSLLTQQATTSAARLLRTLSRGTDDATVLIVRNRS